MTHKYTKYLAILSILLPTLLGAQEQPLSQEEKDKKLYEEIEKAIETYQESLKLEDWQVFYMDSILTHDYFAMNKEVSDMQKRGMSNIDSYYQVQDKWGEQMYVAIKKILNEEQWAKYLKTGAAREKKARDKREEKRKK